jgi:hypothetical protein
MGRNTGHGYRQGEVRERSQVQNPKTGDWIKRDTETGEFVRIKHDGEPFKGVRREHQE